MGRKKAQRDFQCLGAEDPSATSVEVHDPEKEGWGPMHDLALLS